MRFGLVLLDQGLADRPNRLVSPLSAVIAAAVPLLAARLTSVAMLVLAAMVTRPGKPAPSVLSIAVVGGALDMTANGLFLWSTLDGELAVVGALVSLFPATTVLLAVAFLGERLDRKQFAGLALAVVTAALLS